MLDLSVPDHVRPVRDRVLAFMVDHVEPAEPVVLGGGDGGRDVLRDLQARAKAEGFEVSAWPTNIPTSTPPWAGTRRSGAPGMGTA